MICRFLVGFRAVRTGRHGTGGVDSSPGRGMAIFCGCTVLEEEEGELRGLLQESPINGAQKRRDIIGLNVVRESDPANPLGANSKQEFLLTIFFSFQITSFNLVVKLVY